MFYLHGLIFQKEKEEKVIFDNDNVTPDAEYCQIHFIKIPKVFTETSQMKHAVIMCLHPLLQAKKMAILVSFDHQKKIILNTAQVSPTYSLLILNYCPHHCTLEETFMTNGLYRLTTKFQVGCN